MLEVFITIIIIIHLLEINIKVMEIFMAIIVLIIIINKEEINIKVT